MKVREQASEAACTARARALWQGAAGWAGARRVRWPYGVGGARQHRASWVIQHWGAAEGGPAGTGRMD